LEEVHVAAAPAQEGREDLAGQVPAAALAPLEVDEERSTLARVLRRVVHATGEPVDPFTDAHGASFAAGFECRTPGLGAFLALAPGGEFDLRHLPGKLIWGPNNL